MEILHISAFRVTLEEVDLLTVEALKDFLQVLKDGDSSLILLPHNEKKLQNDYYSFGEKMREGKHGKIAQL